MKVGTVVVGVYIALLSASALAETRLVPLRLHAGVNLIPDIAGDGKIGSITLNWRDNGNAWGYDIYTVLVGKNVVTHEAEGQDGDQFRDAPHTGEDMITSVRFARGLYRGRNTLIALVARRLWQTSVPDPAVTTITIYALTKNDDGIGTPYQFVQTTQRRTTRKYCNADMALQTELGFPLSGSYSGPHTVDAC